ncbi:peptide deformylase, partial [Spongiactinospora gelatinilytica]
MTLQQIRLFGDPVLRRTAEPVTAFDRELRTLVKQLTATMRAGSG